MDFVIKSEWVGRLGSDGLMHKMHKKAKLPMYSRVYGFGFGMSENVFAVISGLNEFEQQKLVSISDYENCFGTIDEYSQGISKKFGIGNYFDDVSPDFRYEKELVDKYIKLATDADSKREADRLAQEEADRKEVENLPKAYPHLTPLSKANSGYAAERANVMAELKKRFPNQKFSIKKGSCDSIDICWTDGLTENEVESVSDLFVAYENDWSGDFRDYSPSNFNRVFGGFKYVSTRRSMSDDIMPLKEFLEKDNKFNDIYKSSEIIRKVWAKTSIPKGAKNFSIVRNECKGGQWEDFYDLKFDSDEVKPLETKPTIETPDGIKIVEYSEKSIAVIGETKAIKDKLKELGGRFNFRLTCGAGWIFSKKQESAVRMALSL